VILAQRRPNDKDERMQLASRTNIAVFDLGGTGPSLIFCHATGFHGLVWRQVAAHLADNFHCYTMDFRGHGDSPRNPGQSLVWDELAQDLVQVVQELSEEPILAVGHSMGGACIVIGELAHPGTFKAAWLFEPILFPQRDNKPEPAENNLLAQGARKRREIFDSRDAALQRYASRPPLCDFFPETLADYVNHGFADHQDGGVILKCRGETEASVFESATRGALDSLNAIAMPIHVAHGDGGLPADLAPLVADAIPGAEVEHMHGLTHFGPLEDPTRVAASITAFLVTKR